MQKKRVAIKNHVQEIQLITRQCIVAFIIMLILVSLLIARLAFLQFTKHDLYTTLSKKNSLDLVPLEPTRGLIYDRNGVLLAENIPVFGLDVIPYKVTNTPHMLADIARIVPLSDDEIAQFQKQLKEHRRFDEVTLKVRLTEEEVARFSENQYRFPGVIVKAHLLRHYPLGDAFSHVLGYVGRINMDELQDIDPINYSATDYIGKLGIEKFYEEELHGAVGYQQAENDASGETVRVLKQINPTPGKNLYLSIDSKLQIAAEQALSGYRGAIVAIKPTTGEVLALVSEPSYDPNIFVTGVSAADYKILQQSPNRPLYNRSIRGLYPFASTIKPFIALEGLNSGIATPDFTILDLGWYKLKNSTHEYHDWRKHGHGIVNISKAITSSCDTYFYDLAYKLGINRIDNILEAFGFGEITGVDLEEELPGVVASPAWKKRVKGVSWYPGDTVISGIGQGFMQVTPLQLAVGVATIANRGKRYTPHIVLAQQDPGKKRQEQEPATEPDVKINNPDIWKLVINAMEGVIRSPDGTNHHFGLPDYSVAAKTGTAQVYSIKHFNIEDNSDDDAKVPERLRNHSLFIAFAPVDKPQIAIAVLVENSKLAPSIARKVLDYYLLGAPEKPVPIVIPFKPGWHG